MNNLDPINIVTFKGEKTRVHRRKRMSKKLQKKLASDVVSLFKRIELSMNALGVFTIGASGGSQTHAVNGSSVLSGESILREKK